MKLVKFADGTFGVRKGWFKRSYEFLDLSSPVYWWCITHHNFRDCKGTLVEAKAAKAQHMDYGKPVKEESI